MAAFPIAKIPVKKIFKLLISCSRFPILTHDRFRLIDEEKTLTDLVLGMTILNSGVGNVTLSYKMGRGRSPKIQESYRAKE
ncbi:MULTISPECIES: hypothetical protein [Spirulina sp. CCY15215]|uniref:hypothetical protein n=1 Tax=Spirulina sp. CCY15215 TaxID=2767591 RepID=UPI001950798D|nr:hypothetical protein [Spirulina major]